MEPTIYKRPHVYKSSVYKRYSIYNGLGVYKLPYGSPQGWTKENVPAGVQTLHDFGDGAGAVPAIPTDAAGVSDTLLDFEQRKIGFYTPTDAAGVSDTLLDFEQKKIGFYTPTDAAGVSDTLLDFEVLND